MTDEQKEARRFYHLYETNEGITQHVERIVELEDMVMEMASGIESLCDKDVISCNLCPFIDDGVPCSFTKIHFRMQELGIEV